MKKTLFQLLFLLSAISVKSQIIMTVDGKKYDVSEIDSIVFRSVEIPSATTLMANSGEYTIFSEALRRTGLADSLVFYEKDREYKIDNPIDRDGNILYYPKHCDIGWTLFAENDSVFSSFGIYNFKDLEAKCKEWYANPSWYNVITEKSIKISTDEDYTSEWNVVHMFVAYHIVRAKIAVNELVYERTPENTPYWNYCFGYEPQAYYETMLPGALLKVWATDTQYFHYEPNLWINRYVKNNTLTDQFGTFGSDAMHPLIYNGAKIDRKASIEAMNAYVHSIDKILLYDENAYNAQHERMRFHINQMLPELASNGLIRASFQKILHLSHGRFGSYLAFPTDYFDNLYCFDNNTRLIYTCADMWRALESTFLRGWGLFDFAIRLPHVPSGQYEIRFIYAPSGYSNDIVFYYGNSCDTTTMRKLGTLDIHENPYSSNIGYVEINPEVNEFGIEAEKVMRQNGYMYAPASYSRGTYNVNTHKLTVTKDDPYAACKQIAGSSSCRSEGGYGTMSLRYIVGTVDIKQSQDSYLRLKNVGREFYYWNFHFIELVPLDIANNGSYMEDWY